MLFKTHAPEGSPGFCSGFAFSFKQKIKYTFFFMKNLLLFGFLLSIGSGVSAQVRQKQSSFEVGFLFGVTLYSGDLTAKPVVIKETQPGYGAFLRYSFNHHLALKAHVYSGSISGDDRHAASLRARSFRFSSSIIELAMVGEWSPFARGGFSSTGERHFHLTPYLFGGIGRTFVSTRAEYYGPPERRDEFVKVPFPEPGLPTQFMMVPIGGGLKLDLFERVTIGGEIGWRPVFSDAIDGIKQNANPGSGDWYYFGGVTVSFILSDPKRW